MDATIRSVAESGVSRLRVPEVTAAAGLDRGAASRLFGGLPQLLMATTQTVARVRALPQAPVVLSAEQCRRGRHLEILAAGHHRYVEDSPEKFAAILQLTSAALLGDHQGLLGPLAARQRRTRQDAIAHLALLQQYAVISPHADLPAAAELFVAGLNGIEMCELIDPWPPRREAAYRELCDVVQTRLGHPDEAGP